MLPCWRCSRRCARLEHDDDADRRADRRDRGDEGDRRRRRDIRRLPADGADARRARRGGRSRARRPAGVRAREAVRDMFFGVDAGFAVSVLVVVASVLLGLVGPPLAALPAVRRASRLPLNEALSRRRLGGRRPGPPRRAAAARTRRSAQRPDRTPRPRPPQAAHAATVSRCRSPSRRCSRCSRVGAGVAKIHAAGSTTTTSIRGSSPCQQAVRLGSRHGSSPRHRACGRRRLGETRSGSPARMPPRGASPCR